MSPLINQGKLKTILLAIMMIFSSALAGCVTDGTTITTGEDENNNGGNETANNTGNETGNNTGNETGNNTGDIPCEPNFDTNETNLPDGSCCSSGGQCESMNCNYENWTCESMPEMIDSDGDGLPDQMETTQYGTDPQNSDTDGDGLDDGWEIQNGLDPLDACEGCVEDTDTDGDGYTDWCEDFWGTDPNSPNDFPSQQQTCDQNGDGLPDHWPDGWELEDTDMDGLNNYEEFWNGTNPTNPDTDGDGMPDGWEVEHGLDPLDPSDADLDNDMDNLSNLEEFDPSGVNTTNPNNPDSDGDGENDDVDLFPKDPNNGQYVDSDQDGYNDSVEIDCQSDPQDFNSIPQDTDGDGICDPMDPVNDLITMWGNNSAHFLYVKPDTIDNSNIENARPYQIEFSANPMAEQNPVVLTHICDKEQGHVADVWSAFVLGPFPYDIISWHIYNTNGQSIGMFVSNDNLKQSSNMTFPTVISTQDVENQSNGHLEAEVIDSQYYTCEFDYTDTDGDGVLDWMDAFPNDANEWEDLDGDGIGNNADSDDDGDTCDDQMDWAPLNSSECFDTDGDGIGDNSDLEPWINNTSNGTFTMNYTMIGITAGHELYWLAGQQECPCYAYYYTTTPDLVWTTGNRSPVVSHENMPNVDFVLGLMGLTIDNLSVSSYPMNLGTDTQGVEWDYNSNTGLEWRNLSSNLSILYVDDKPLFSINAYMMLYLDYYPMMSGNPPTMWGESSFSPITSMLVANDALIYQQLFNAFFEDFGENNINYLFNTQDAIITNDFVFTISTPDTTAWLDSIISNSGGNGVQGGLFDSVVSETNVESSQNGITMSKSVIKSKNLAIFSERNEKEESIY